jgi:hypothetical protein
MLLATSLILLKLNIKRELARISKWSFPSFPSSGLGTASPKLELLHSCVPKLELGNKKEKICTHIK